MEVTNAITSALFSREMRRRARDAQRTGRGFTPPGPGTGPGGSRTRPGGGCCLIVIIAIVAYIIYLFVDGYVLHPVHKKSGMVPPPRPAAVAAVPQGEFATPPGIEVI